MDGENQNGIVKRSALLRRRRDEISLMNSPEAYGDERPRWVEGASTADFPGDGLQPAPKAVAGSRELKAI